MRDAVDDVKAFARNLERFLIEKEYNSLAEYFDRAETFSMTLEMTNDEEDIGLSTREALGRLKNDIEAVLKEKDWSLGSWCWLKDSLGINSPNSTLSWLSAVFILFCAFCLFLVASAGNESSPSKADGLTLLLFLAVNLAVILWDSKLRRTEVVSRTRVLADSIARMQTEVSWIQDNYPHLSSPTSPCITLQWTWRDKQVVNLPWALLVRGDVILMRPGQPSPGLCKEIDVPEPFVLQPREMFNPQVSRESLSLPATRSPLENKLFALQETPYLRNLRLVLEQSLKRPVSFHDKERHLLVTRCIEHCALPLLGLLVFVMNYVRHFHLDDLVGRDAWFEVLIVQPVTAVLPLLPLTFPIAWRLVNSWGFTKLRAVLQDTTPTQVSLDPFEDADLETSKLQFGELWRYYWDDLIGRGPLLCRSANILHVLGSVTALCCVDKKGVLSWPNPTAEKVFFLRRSDEVKRSKESLKSEGRGSTHNEDATDPLQAADAGAGSEGAAVEVLDLTHEHTSPFRLHFDDHSWKQHISSLKPLGLAVLLNTCNANSQEVYSQFCCHLMCEASQNESLVPVTNRRCLCELPAQIGFLEHAQDGFVLEQLLCTFQHAKAESVKRDIKFARQLSKSTKLKFPFPHMVGAVLRDKQTGCLQLMSQGTADVILDSCVEYWDGNDLHPLTPCLRKKILDFYQRSSLTANCTAFAYRPLSKSVGPKLSQNYLELPTDSRHLYLPYRSPTPLALSMLDNKWRGVFAQFHSSDSLLGWDGKEEEVTDIDGWVELQCNQVFVGMVTMQYQAQADVVHLIEQLERACIRFVHFSKENELRSRVFSEKMGLESGWNCHISLLSDRCRSEGGQSVEGSKSDLAQQIAFSPERPVYFQPKTSHTEIRRFDPNERINLNASRAMSFSAPSAINLDTMTVKFDEHLLNWHDDDLTPPNGAMSHRDRRISQDSVVMPSEGEQWRSLSCLTDSTDQSVPFAFDIANRAKLPRGIDKIRPHLELIDNVPLLVSLFTDCTSTVTREMLHIMQDYGEVVCVFGSSANCENVGLFLQADASIAVEPLYPQVCQKHPVFSAPTPCSGPSPVEVSRALNSLPCAVSMRREDPLSMFQLITCARDFCLSLRNFLQFWLCSMSSITVLLVVASLLLLPPPLNTGQVLFLCCLLIPLLSASLMALPTDPQVMCVATGKNQCNVTSEVVTFVLWCYGLKCLPSILILTCLYLSSLSFFCETLTEQSNSTSSCTLIYPTLPALLEDDVIPSSMGGWSQFRYSILFLQHCAALILVLHLVAASASYVHRGQSILRRPPVRHISWVAVCLAVPLLQLLYSVICLAMTGLRDASPALGSVALPWTLVVSGLTSPILVLAAHEAVKWQETKVNKRFQRRQRLDFGTKLGMNSPF